MPTYEFECEEGHQFEIFCSISSKPENPSCPAEFEDGTICGKTSRQVILSAPFINNSELRILDYPGSKRLKAGYVHSHGPKMATKTQVGYGGKVEPVRRHLDPIADWAQPEALRHRKNP